MTPDLLLPLIARWAHILSAIIAVGGSLFIRLVLMPAASVALTHEENERLGPALMRRWKYLVHTCILLFLLSGTYNYLAITRFQHAGQPLYHILLGLKILLALAVFYLAIALTSPGELFARIKTRRAQWLTALVALAVLVVLISGFIRTMPKSLP
jgi:uncharacterized membrane protein